MPDPLLSVRNLRAVFDAEAGAIVAVDDVSFDLHAGQVLGLVGESGSGKSVTALSLMRLLPPAVARITGGEIRFEGRDLCRATPREMQALRGAGIAMIFQEPMTSLNPLQRIGRQIAEPLVSHRGLSWAAGHTRALALLRRVGIPDPEQRLQSYPHELSGGMRQRAMIAMALACSPRLLIADEPTTALDVTIQAQILELLKSLQAETGMAVLLISHDLGIVAEVADRVAVMYAGRLVELADVRALFALPGHPYTEGLLRSMPEIDSDQPRLQTIEGTVPNPREWPAGCRFAPRCTFARDACRAALPPWRPLGPDHHAACIR